jgi:hypothetical protein
MKKTLRRLGLPHLVVVVAIALVLGSGSAYAAKQISGKNIKNNTVTTKDIKDESLSGADVADGSLSSLDILDGTLTGADVKDASLTGTDVQDGTLGSVDITDSTITTNDVAADTLTAADLATNSVGQLEIATDGVAATEIEDDSIDAGEIVDFGLSNQDIGVLFAQVNSNGTLANNCCAGSGITSTHIGAANSGQYEVNFQHNIVNCAYFGNVAGPTNVPAEGEISIVDRASNANAVFVQVNDSAGAAADRPFHVMVVC